MQSFLARIDRLLRTRPEDGFRALGGVPPDERTTALGWRHSLLAILALGALYGAAMGLYAVLGRGGGADGWKQLVATAVKVPLLFLATLAITYPSLYVVSALAGSQLAPRATTALLLASTTVTVALLASLAPITVFFTLSTESYAFVVLLNVGFFAAAGFVGLAYLRRALDAAFPTSAGHRAVEPKGAGESPEGAPPPLEVPRQPPAGKTPARRVFEAWTLLFGVVGAQMGWVLRPFVGDPALPFALFREREGNFLLAVLRSLGQLLGPG